MKNLYITVVLLLIYFLGTLPKASAQVEPQFSNYMYNVAQFNSAYVGEVDYSSLTGIHRSQWTGFEGAPETQFLSFATPLNNEKMGLGLNLYQDKLGPSRYRSFSVLYAYKLKISEEAHFSLGLNGGGSFFNVDFTEGNFEIPGDNAQEQIDNRFYARVGAGFIINVGNWFGGLSVPNFFKEEFYDAELREVIADKIQWNLLVGHYMKLNENWIIRPSVLVNIIQGNPITLTSNLNFLYNDRWSLGAGYRYSESLNGQFGVQVVDDLFIGYSYDYGIGDFSGYHDGSHEIILKFTLKGKRVSKEKGLASY
jgi:type IX secretion system PorP/SprF family membrane protein